MRPGAFRDAADDFAASLDDDDPFIRAHAALALGAIAGRKYIGKILIIRNDASKLRRYNFQNGDFEETGVSVIVRKIEGCNL